jgi:hypothetical protein
MQAAATHWIIQQVAAVVVEASTRRAGEIEADDPLEGLQRVTPA